MANRNGSQIVHRGAEIKTMPRTSGGPIPLAGADFVPPLMEEETVPPLAGDEGVLAATGEIVVEPVIDVGGPVSDPMNSEPLYA